LRDGQRVVVAYLAGRTSVVDVVDTRTERTQRVLEDRGNTVDVAPGDDAIFYMWRGTDQRRRIYRLDLHTLETSVVYDAGRQGALGSDAFAVSPDGQELLVVARAGDDLLLRIVHRDGSTTDRHRIDGDCLTAVAWSPDGQHLGATCMMSPYRPVTFWIVPVGSGAPIAQQVDTELVSDLSIRADGRALAFTAGNPPPRFYTLSGF
jgi:dipeptidyl aminopeptidase/acylaminoacyl peptidase